MRKRKLKLFQGEMKWLDLQNVTGVAKAGGRKIQLEDDMIGQA